MKVTEKQIHIDSNYFSAERDVSRTKGPHLSQIIDYIEDKKYEKVEGGGLSKNGHAYAAAGFLWERVLERLIERSKWEMWDWLFGRAIADIDNPKVFRPGEQCMDGGECPICAGKGTLLNPVRMCDVCKGVGRILIFLTPDGVNIEDFMLEEWKHTSKSAKSSITDAKFSRWVSWQIPAYLKTLNMRVCRLRVYFSKGDYTNGVPMWMEFILEYTQQEIDEIWESICNHAQDMIRSNAAA